jgi:transcriptional regulator NrdR family protein
MSQRLLTDVSRNVVTDDELRGQALNLATARVQSEADERVRNLIGEHHIASAVVATLADEKDIRALRYAGVCMEELAEIARITLSGELKQLMRMVCSLPVISVEEL